CCVNVAARLVPGSSCGGRRSTCALYFQQLPTTAFLPPSFRQSGLQTLTLSTPEHLRAARREAHASVPSRLILDNRGGHRSQSPLEIIGRDRTLGTRRHSEVWRRGMWRGRTVARPLRSPAPARRCTHLGRATWSGRA